MPFTGSVSRVGHISQGQREGHARFNWVMLHIDERFRAVVAALVLGVRAERDGKAWSLEQMGQKATAWMDKSTRKGVGLGLMKSALWRVHEAYQEYEQQQRNRRHNTETLRRQREHDDADKRLDKVRKELEAGGKTR